MNIREMEEVDTRLPSALTSKTHHIQLMKLYMQTNNYLTRSLLFLV